MDKDNVIELQGRAGSAGYLVDPFQNRAITVLQIPYEVERFGYRLDSILKWPRLSVQTNPIYKWIPASFQAAIGSGSGLL